MHEIASLLCLGDCCCRSQGSSNVIVITATLFLLLLARTQPQEIFLHKVSLFFFRNVVQLQFTGMDNCQYFRIQDAISK